ncbi:hypothetical protein M3Y98_00479700 [Aphelenchoides besseyi]|nr:hypothetical protein M3Y98_00479700 [Aphelenchoides besseyi]
MPVLEIQTSLSKSNIPSDFLAKAAIKIAALTGVRSMLKWSFLRISLLVSEAIPRTQRLQFDSLRLESERSRGHGSARFGSHSLILSVRNSEGSILYKRS